MARIERAVFDAGPFIHLQQVGALRALGLFRRVWLTEEVRRELRPAFPLPGNCEIRPLLGASKDLARLLADRYQIALGEASAIALAKQERVHLLFTDDADGRDAAKHAGLEPHGTIAILVRAYREGVLSRAEALGLLEALHTTSTLYLTRDLVAWTRRQIESFRRP